MHPNLKGNSWHGLRVKYPADSTEKTTMFVGRFKDNNYHVLGYIPDSIKFACSEDSESRGDHGIVNLPKGKKTISDLVQGDVFSFAPPKHKGEPYPVKYLSPA